MVLPSGTTNGGLPNLRGGIFFQVTPTAIFNAQNHICPGTCTSFNNLTLNGTSFIWSFPGANPSVSTDVNPTSICYNTPGTYPVSLIASNSVGSDTITLNNYITVYPFPAPQGINQSGDTLFANTGAFSYQWFQDGILIPGATDYYYVAPSSGNYSVVATDENHCEVEAVILNVIASVSTATADHGWSLSPNPAEEQIILSGPASRKNIRVSIYNCIGEEVYKTETENHVVAISSLARGMYWLTVTDGTVQSHLRLIKK